MKRFGEFWTCPDCKIESLRDNWVIDSGYDLAQCPECGSETDFKKTRFKKRIEQKPRYQKEIPEEHDEDYRHDEH